jgi:predicted NBD/HSP70 family sugar kinase
MASRGITIVFDMGATRTRLAVVSEQHTLARPHWFETNHSSLGWRRLLTGIRELAGGDQIRCVIGGVPGQTDPKNHKLTHLPNLPHWEGQKLLDRLQEELGCEVKLYNDTALVGLGEAIYGAGRGYAIVMYETVSTGVNAVRIVDGRIDRAAVGFEVGAQLLPGPGGRVTSLEAATGGAALERRKGRAPKELASQALWRSEARLLAHGLYNSLVHWSPEVVVFGGSMMNDIAVTDIAAELKKMPPVYGAWPKLVKAKLADAGGLYGALALARRS